MAEKAGHESRREPVSIYDRLPRVCVLLESLGPAVTADQAGVVIRAWRKDGDSWGKQESSPAVSVLWIGEGKRAQRKLLHIVMNDKAESQYPRLKLNESTVLSNGGYSFAAVKGNFPIGIGVSVAMKAHDQMCPRVSQEEGDRQAVQSSGHHSTVKGPLPYSKYIPGIKFLNDNTLEPPDNRSCKCCAKAAVQLWLPLNSFTSIRFHTVDKAVDIQDQSGRDGPRDCFPESGL
ncbi:hypothetical protein MG293_014922 [Ovis ammon polii]|uniref:Uncharacterized protein n=1 Tax=Ovis ammon polii TaxID=230172 RepID=A0AAD4TTN4_OVIAM|nr:hypothetical protein MG293_014922 [Ovis ammon polii]